MEDTIGVPVDNQGTFNANDGTGGQVTGLPGSLLILGQYSAQSVSFYQEAGAFNLMNLADGYVGSGNYQSAGSLTSDSTPAGTANILETGFVHSDINIAGGKVVVDTTANSVGTLKFNASTVEIDGEVDLSGQTLPAGNSKLCDLLACGNGQLTWGTSSFLNIGVTGGFGL